MQVVADLGRARDRLLAVGVIAALAAGRRMIGELYFAGRKSRRHVHLADVDEAARPQLKFQKTLAVGAQRDLVIDAGRHVAEMRRRQLCRITALKSRHVQSFLGACDQMVIVRPITFSNNRITASKHR